MATATMKTEGRDKFGSRLGSLHAKANAVLSKKAKSMKEIMEEAGLDHAVRNHMMKLIERGLVEREGTGYRLASKKADKIVKVHRNG